MPARLRTPWHLWPIGLLALLWGAAGAIDYVAVRFGMTAYTSRLPGTWMAWLEGLPAWVTGLWAVAVWAGLLGAVLLLMRERGAVLVFAAAFIAMILVALALNFAVSPPLVVAGGQAAVWVSAGSALFLVLLWFYARRLKIAGLLE